MDIEQATKVKELAINFASKAIAKRCDYRKRLVDVIEDIFSCGEIEDVVDWDNGNPDMSDHIDDYFVPCGFTVKFQDDVSCSIRIAVDLLIKQGGGVVGYTVGDLKKAFDGEIPNFICERYEGDLNSADESEGIWL